MPQANQDTSLDLTLAHELELRLAEARGTLSANDEVIAEFLRGHLSDLAFQTAESLAQGCDVSAAAVVRFSRRLGFASFRELRDRARAEVRQVEVRQAEVRQAEGRQAETAAGDGVLVTGQSGVAATFATGERASTLERKVRSDIASLELLPRLLGEPLQRAAAVAAHARSISFLANRETYGLTVYAHRLLRQARGNVGLIDPGFPDPIRDLGPEDVLIACTFRPYARNTLDLIAGARPAGVRVILVTDGLAHGFIDPADVVLAVPVDSPTLFLSFTPAMCVLETLAALIAAQDPDVTYESLDAGARFVETHSLMLDRTSLPHRTDSPGPST